MLRKAIQYCVITSLLLVNMACNQDSGEWIQLFNGQTLEGWKASENPGTFYVEDSMIIVNGDRAHLFYEGPVMNHNFKNFEFKANVMTTPGSNSGIFFHTEYQEEGWPAKGYEVQVNNSHEDWRRTGSLYAVYDIRELHAEDNEWFTEHIIVQDDQVTVKVNDKVLIKYTEESEGRLGYGTFALQGHDPESKVYFKDVMVKPLPD